MQTAEQKSGFRLSDQYQTLKTRLHQHLIRLLEDGGAEIEEWSKAKASEFIRSQVRNFVKEQRLAVNQNESGMLAEDTLNELIGFGPIQALVDDDGVSDIVVNGPEHVFTERDGKLVSEPLRFNNDAHVIRVIQRILAPLGRRVDESTPMVDARLPDGSRVNAIIPPIALDGPCVSIRKFRANPLSDRELVRLGSVTQPILDYLREQVQKRRNILVIGGTGSGKTTFLNLISQWVSKGERIITIEDAAELRLHHTHVVRLETRPPNLEGEREVTARDLVRNTLRMRPDRIIVGEVRGDEVLDMLQAMNTGHDGSMTTLHANSPRDAIHRLQLLAGFAGFTGDERTLLHQIASAIDLIVHVTRLASGKRRLVAIQAVNDVVGDTLQIADIFGYDADTDQHQDLRATGGCGVILAIFSVLTLLLLAAAILMYARARSRENEESFAERVGQPGTGEVIDELVSLRNLQRIRNPVTRVLCHRFWGAGIDVKPANANILLVAFAVITLLLLLVEPFLGIALAVSVVAVGYLFLQQRVNARRRRILDQMPDYLEYVMRSLTAGNTLEEALQSAALESRDPIRSLFLSVSRQVRLGATVESTLGEAAAVHNLRALHILAMSARVNRRFGGSLRRVVKSLTYTIRRQDAAVRELKALTGETRFSAWIVAAIPIAISGFFYFLNPGYYTDMLASSGGRFALVIALALQALGIFIIWRMIASLREPNL